VLVGATRCFQESNYAQIAAVAFYSFWRPHRNQGQSRSWLMAIYYAFHCKNCQIRTRFPLRTILEATKYRGNEIDSVALACEHCKHVDIYSLKAESPAPNGSEDRVERPPTVEIQIHGFIKFLDCEDRRCRTPLLVIAPRSLATTDAEDEAYASAWEWDELRCPNGHLILKPKAAALHSRPPLRAS
jgi:hypothetical protein